MARLSGSSSDEEVRGLHAPQAVPYEIRSAKRTAATALLVSAAACLCSVGMVIHKRTAGAPALVAPATSAAIGLSEEDPLERAAAEIDGLLTETHAMQSGMRPVPHHLTAPMALRAEGSTTSAIQQRLSAGVQVFPLSKKYGWYQVVVPETEVGGVKQTANFGWLPEHTDDGAILLVEDQELLNRKYSAYRAAPPSPEVVQAKWDGVRSKNKELQAQIVELQKSMATGQPHHEQEKDRMTSKEQRSKGGAAVKAEVNKIVELNELSKTAHQLHTNLAKELKSGKLIDSIGKAFG